MATTIILAIYNALLCIALYLTGCLPRAWWGCQQYLQRVDCWLQCQWCWEGRKGLGRTHRCQVPSPNMCQSCFQANEESWWRRRRRRHWDTCTLATESNPLLGQCQYWSDHSILHWVAFQDCKVLNSACKECLCESWNCLFIKRLQIYGKVLRWSEWPLSPFSAVYIMSRWFHRMKLFDETSLLISLFVIIVS